LLGLRRTAIKPQLILNFHGIGEPPPAVTPEERPFWLSVDAFVWLIKSAKVVARDLGVEILATFDDGNRSDCDVASDVLLENGVSGAFFPCTGRLAHSNYLDAKDIRALSKMGFEIGSHGVNHVIWPKLAEEELLNEIHASKVTLEKILGQEVRSVAVPFGAYNRSVLSKLREAGYRSIYTSDPGLVWPGFSTKGRWTLTVEQLPVDLYEVIGRYRSSRYRLIRGMTSFLRSQI
jgi:peptidoglycan/xylan/chitin deacetylase (PgdA/CDA1 family)